MSARQITGLCLPAEVATPERPEGVPVTCGSAGTLPLCQLCPNSPTYWRDNYDPPPATPEQRAEAKAGLVPLADRGTVFDWSRTLKSPKTESCVICGHGTRQLSPKGKPCHKSCAEKWQNEHRSAPKSPTALL